MAASLVETTLMQLFQETAVQAQVRQVVGSGGSDGSPSVCLCFLKCVC